MRYCESSRKFTTLKQAKSLRGTRNDPRSGGEELLLQRSLDRLEYAPLLDLNARRGQCSCFTWRSGLFHLHVEKHD